MKHALLFSLLLTACATAPAPVTAPTAEPAAMVAAAAPQCTPGHALINASLWVQSAAEYRASALQTYAAARRQLDAALADRTFTGAEEEKNEDPSQPPAVILDLDETALDNVAYEARMIKRGMTYDKDLWRVWVGESAARAVPGASEFLAYAQSRGVTPFYITNRDFDPEHPGTRRNLERLGFPLTADNLLMRGTRPEWRSDKSGRRAHVASTHRVLLVIGDDLNDFTNAREKSQADRDAIMERTASWWGTRWFMLPNPMYGSWEGAATGDAERTPCEQLQRKIDVLRDR
jgi:5'-nucleotidase (lipoprotein e(P4) family)